MKAIGGFFETEQDLSGTEGSHPAALALSSGRASFRAILESVQPRQVRVPFYVCDALLEPLRLLQIPFRFFGLDSGLLPPESLTLEEGEFLVAVDYFGLKSGPITALAKRWGGKLIIDNTQAYFEGPTAGCFSFNSARKFFGVPDGSFLYAPRRLSMPFAENNEVTRDHLTQRAAGDLAGAYLAYQAAEERVTSEIKGISRYSFDTLQRIPHWRVREQRRQNFAQYEMALAGLNTLAAPVSPDAVPFCYPFLPERKIDRTQLHRQNIFIPTFWPEIIGRASAGFPLECKLAQDLLPLPVDHRYGSGEIETVIQAVKHLLHAPLTRN